MTQPVVKNRLINFHDLDTQDEEFKKCHREAYNSLMIKISDLDKYDVVEDFTHCENVDCKMVLTNEDKDYIDDWNWVSSNEDHYSDIAAKIEIMRKNKWAYYVWNCRFCGAKNLIEKDKAYFAKNKTKVVIKEGIQAGESSKASESQLLLFLIDNSSSMEEEIPEFNEQPSEQKKKTNEVLNPTLAALKKTQIYQKITENEKKVLSDLKKTIDPDSKDSFTDHYSKYKILMGMTETMINDIREGKHKQQESIKLEISKDNPPSRKIGFMFFNSIVTLQKISQKAETKVIKIEHKEFASDKSKEGSLKVNFENFKDLYNIGKENSENYGMELENFKFEDIELKDMVPSGQTALGPALVIASGIVSGYGSGSLIVVVTDGKANKGIFGVEGAYEDEKRLLRLRLEKAKAELCLLKLENKSVQNVVESESALDKFMRKQTIIVSLFEKEPLKELQKKLGNIIAKLIQSKTWTNEIKVKCQNPNIKYDKEVKKMKTKLFSKAQTEFMTPSIEESKFMPFDYRHPFMTQILVYYQNLETKQESKFMAFIMQKLIKFSEMNKKDEESFGSHETLVNVLKYLEVEGEKLDLTSIPLSMSKLSFRSAIMESYKHSSAQGEWKRDVMGEEPEMLKSTQPAKTFKEAIINLKETKEEAEEESNVERL